MKNIILISLLVLVSCLPDATKISEELKCNLLGSEDSIALKINAEEGSVLPANLSVSLKANGSELLIDECSGESSIFVEQDRTAVAARFILEKGSSLHDYYFPSESEDPVVDTAAYELSKRSSCSVPLESIVERPNIVITWLPVFANGEECSKTSNTGYSSFKVTP